MSQTFTWPLAPLAAPMPAASSYASSVAPLHSLLLSIDIYRPQQKDPTRFRFSSAWTHEEAQDVVSTGDVRLTWSGPDGNADIGIVLNDLEREGGLRTAVLLSVFVDRRADDSDAIPDGETDRRGWWGDSVPVVDGDLIGSRLWLLSRAKDTADIARTEEYVRESLQWMLDDQVAERIEVTIEATRPVGEV